jgi:hypothetical protein
MRHARPWPNNVSSPNTTKPPRIVAELGRPETPDETAARKAENSRAHRANQTTRNLVLALLASLAVVLFTVLIVVRPDQALTHYVDYKAVAKSAQSGVSAPLAAPNLPSTWKSNDAELKSDSASNTTWYLGLITPKQQFIAIEEGVKTSDTWFGSLLGQEQPTGHKTIAGITWTVYDRHTTVNSGNYIYALSATIESTKYVLHGSASATEFRQLATALADQINTTTEGTG